MAAKGQRSPDCAVLRQYAAAPGLPVLPRTGCTRGPFGFCGSPVGLTGAMPYLAAAAFGAPLAAGSSAFVVFRISSANLRWLASSCSAKS
jgi:hypothetical protein